MEAQKRKTSTLIISLAEVFSRAKFPSFAGIPLKKYLRFTFLDHNTVHANRNCSNDS
jgi:hypothetical protein